MDCKTEGLGTRNGVDKDSSQRTTRLLRRFLDKSG
jgi:hypothetical protein